jgi:uncharacterized membrane protein YeaQ/YmgE (transglycosylase-associated protein family)
MHIIIWLVMGGFLGWIARHLLARAREALKAFEGSVDAIIAHWDFPTSVLMPIPAGLGASHRLARVRGDLRTQVLESR